GTDIGDALGARRIGIEGHDGYAGCHRRVDRFGHRRDVGDRDRQAVHLLRDEVLDDLRLGRRFVLDRSLVDALNVTEFLGALETAVARHVEERVVHRLGYDHKTVGLGKRWTGHHGDRHAGKKKLPDWFHTVLHILMPILKISLPGS